MLGLPAAAGGNKKEQQVPLLACFWWGGAGGELVPYVGGGWGCIRGLAGAVALPTTLVVLSAGGMFSTLFVVPNNLFMLLLKNDTLLLFLQSPLYAVRRPCPSPRVVSGCPLSMITAQ